MSQINYSRYKYTPDEMNEEDFLSRFAVRKEIVETIFSDLKTSDYNVPNQNYLIIGQRGQGKTTLLRKLQLDVKNDVSLSAFLLPVKFAEEQYQIRSLCRLWEEVAEYLQVIYPEIFPTISDDMEVHYEDEDYELKCFDLLDKAIRAQSKKLLLLIDNIDELLEKLSKKEQHRLREILLSSSTLRIVGGSTKMIEQHFDYSSPFYQFFKIIKLKGLSFEESKEFLLAIAKEDQKERITSVLEKTPERVETLRRLTGGVPRTLVMLFDIFLDEEGNAFDDLLKILDEATPLYKHRMDDLPPQLQDIVHTIAMNWDGMFTSEIAKKTKLESKAVSSQLKQLEKYEIVESESAGKNKIYKIRERFFNIWYLMRYGRKKDRQRVEWLVKFFVSWFSQEELENRAKNLIVTMKNGNVKAPFVHIMTEALSYTGSLELATEYRLKQAAKECLEKQNSELSKELSQSEFELLLKAKDLNIEKKIPEALNVLIQSKRASKNILAYIGHLYQSISDFTKAEQYYREAIEKGDMFSYSFLASVYFENSIKREDALSYAKKGYKFCEDDHNTFVLAMILIWCESFQESYIIFEKYLTSKEAKKEQEIFVQWFLSLLMAKGQLYQTKKFMEMPEYELKERFKPIWYALMKLMAKEFPYEFEKMGSELAESVEEILAKIEFYKERYKI
ncbi:AAA family ATPase [Sulfurospirillum oryzae]|uniref:AAA family ATPase n=1 Tax=Sulfurospirillum oryzae TaxID=2976535 RepID=UPI0021E81DD5|nr:NACHT domain-containing protein [Sulfurospirillum oryzae]